MAIGGRPEPEFLLLTGFAVMVNVLAQGAPLRFTQWLWIEHPSFLFEGRRFNTQL